jgi:hypothetical protein
LSEKDGTPAAAAAGVVCEAFAGDIRSDKVFSIDFRLPTSVAAKKCGFAIKRERSVGLCVCNFALGLSFEKFGRIEPEIPQAHEQQDSGASFVQIPDKRYIVRNQIDEAGPDIQKI